MASTTMSHSRQRRWVAAPGMRYYLDFLVAGLASATLQIR
jgi:hypothetical protein